MSSSISATKVDLDLQFTAENGYQIPLRQLFQKGKPVLLNFVYYRCPMFCNLVLNGQTAALRDLAWTAGKEFDVVTISIAPEETVQSGAGEEEVLSRDLWKTDQRRLAVF